MSRRVPRWPAVARLALNLLILLSSVTAIGLISNSAYQHTHTKGINFSGTDKAWPQDLDLLPIEYLLAAAVVTSISSLMASIQSYRRLHAQRLSIIDMTFAGLTVSLFGAWIGGNVILYQSLQAPKPNLMRWACHRRGSPTNIIVNYNAVCQEQIAVQSIAIILSVALLLNVLTFVATRQNSKLKSFGSDITDMKEEV